MPAPAHPKRLLLSALLLASLGLAQETPALPTVQFQALEVQVLEGETATFTITLSQPLTETLSVIYETYGGNATLRDFEYQEGTLVFQPGETQKTVQVNTLQNSKYSGPRFVNLELFPPQGATLASNISKLVILDDESPEVGLGDDFESSAGNLEMATGMKTGSVEVKQGDPLAHPAQDPVEGVWQLELSGTAGQQATRNLRPLQDWTGVKSLSFWYYGQNSGKDIAVALLDGPTSQPAGDWKVSWSEEFDQAAGWQPSEDTWNYAVGGTGWSNSELQYYTNRPETVSTDGQGNLRIRGDKMAPGTKCWYGECKYSSARLSTQAKKEFEYGRIEARMKLPAGKGMWPAFWMLGTNFGTAGWPAGGEIDIMEFIGREPNNVHATIHGPGYSSREGLQITKSIHLDRPASDEFHTFAVEKRPGELKFFLDGQQIQRITPSDLPPGTVWVMDQPFFILVNLAIGGAWPGSPDDTTPFPGDFLIDYVRVYQPTLPQRQVTTRFKEDFTGWKKVELPLAGFAGDPAFNWAGVQHFRLQFPEGATGTRYLDTLRASK